MSEKLLFFCKSKVATERAQEPCKIYLYVDKTVFIFCYPNLFLKKKIKLKRLFVRGCFIEWIIELFFFNFDPDCVEYDEEIKCYPITSSGSPEVACIICYDQITNWEKGTVLRNILIVITSGSVSSISCHRGRTAHANRREYIGTIVIVIIT